MFLAVVVSSVLCPESDRKARFFDLEWNTFEVRERIPNFPPDMIERPANFAEMVDLSSALSKGFDFLRVDLHSIRNKIILGELTNYPNSGIKRLHPREFDYEFGSYWKTDTMEYLPLHKLQRLGSRAKS